VAKRVGADKWLFGTVLALVLFGLVMIFSTSAVMAKSAFRGTGTQDVGLFLEGRIKTGGQTILLRMEGYNLLNHGNILGRAQTTYGDTAVVNPTFGQIVAVGTATNALPSLANIDPPRMFQFQVRYQF